MKTVNVIESVNGTIVQLLAFEESAKGNKQAEESFRQIAKENGARTTDIPKHLEDGYFEIGGYAVRLAHSTNEIRSKKSKVWDVTCQVCGWLSTRKVVLPKCCPDCGGNVVWADTLRNRKQTTLNKTK